MAKEVYRPRLNPVTCAANQFIFQAGDPGTVVYVVQDGEVEILIDGQVVETVGPQGIFGEMALIDGEPRSASARARTACTIGLVNENDFEFMVDENPLFARRLIGILVARLRAMNARLKAK